MKLHSIPYPTGYDGAHGGDRHYEIRQTRERVFDLMNEKAGITNLGVVVDGKDRLNKLAGLMAQFLDFKPDAGKPDTERMVMDVFLESGFIRRGKRNYQWVSAAQDGERVVAMIWPRPLFDMGVQYYASSEKFIDRVEMVLKMNHDVLIDE